MTDQDSSKVPVASVLGKFARPIYSFGDMVKWIARLQNTDDDKYMEEVVGEVPSEIRNGNLLIALQDVEPFCKKRGWKFEMIDSSHPDNPPNNKCEALPEDKLFGIEKPSNPVRTEDKPIHGNSKKENAMLHRAKYLMIEDLLKENPKSKAHHKINKTKNKLTIHGLGEYLTQHYRASASANDILARELEWLDNYEKEQAEKLRKK